MSVRTSLILLNSLTARTDSTWKSGFSRCSRASKSSSLSSLRKSKRGRRFNLVRNAAMKKTRRENREILEENAEMEEDAGVEVGDQFRVRVSQFLLRHIGDLAQR